MQSLRGATLEQIQNTMQGLAKAVPQGEQAPLASVSDPTPEISPNPGVCELAPSTCPIPSAPPSAVHRPRVRETPLVIREPVDHISQSQPRPHVEGKGKGPLLHSGKRKRHSLSSDAGVGASSRPIPSPSPIPTPLPGDIRPPVNVTYATQTPLPPPITPVVSSAATPPPCITVGIPTNTITAIGEAGITINIRSGAVRFDDGGVSFRRRMRTLVETYIPNIQLPWK